MHTVETIVELWERSTDGCLTKGIAYDAKCHNCGAESESHDDPDFDAEYDDEINCHNKKFDEVDVLDKKHMRNNNTAGLFINAYESSKGFPYDALPAYDIANDANPYRVLRSWLSDWGFPSDADKDALMTVLAWLKGWVLHSTK